MVAFYLDERSGAAGKQECIASCVYLGVLLLVLAVGNFARVRFLLFLEILYGIGVLIRSILGVLVALLLIDPPADWGAEGFFNMLVRPLAGLEYIAAQLTSHFVTEIYWLGLALSATILVFLACAATMAVGSRIGRERARQGRSREQSAAIPPVSAERRRIASGEKK